MLSSHLRNQYNSSNTTGRIVTVSCKCYIYPYHSKLNCVDLGEKFDELMKRGCNEEFTSERDFREKIVIKLLEYLGWENNQDVYVEYPIQAGQTTLRVDYLVGDQINKFALEVKMHHESIGPESRPRQQILSYLKLLDDVRYGVLYNGNALLIFKKGIKDPIITWMCGDAADSITYLSKISFPQVLDNLFPDYLDSVKKLNKYKLRAGDSVTVKRQRFILLWALGFTSLVTFFIGFIMAAIKEEVLVNVFVSIFLVLLFAFIIDYVRLRIIYRR